MRADFLVAHAPHSGAEKQKRPQWWKKLEDQVVGRRHSSTPLINMIDANASVGEVETSFIGGHAPTGEDRNGTLFVCSAGCGAIRIVCLQCRWPFAQRHQFSLGPRRPARSHALTTSWPPGRSSVLRMALVFRTMLTSRPSKRVVRP